MMTICQQLLNALNSAFSSKYNSLARYILDAKPYASAGQEPLLAAIKSIADEDRRFADRLAGAIEEAEGVPQLGLFNPEVANLNYLSLDYLSRFLAQQLREDLKKFESFIPLAEDASSAHQLLAELAEATRGQIDSLERS